MGRHVYEHPVAVDAVAVLVLGELLDGSLFVERSRDDVLNRPGFSGD